MDGGQDPTLLASAAASGGNGAGLDPRQEKSDKRRANKDQGQQDDDKPTRVRVVNYKKKAETKVNAGRNILTDARILKRMIETDQKETDMNKRKVCLA